MVFTTNSVFQEINKTEDPPFWSFSFTDNICVYETGFWRLFKNNKIVFISEDHGHQFGLPKPVDLIKEVTEVLKNKKLQEIKVTETGDLNLIIEDNILIEFFITSMGYENYQFQINGLRYIALGGGDIDIYPAP